MEAVREPEVIRLYREDEVVELVANYLLSNKNKWKDELVPERLKCFFTTWAYEYRIGKDQDECESLLKRIYENAEVAGFMDYEEFKEYMLQFVK